MIRRRAHRVAALGSILVFLALTGPPARGHTGTFEHIDLGHDPELKSAVVRTAREYLRRQTGVSRAPTSFSLVNGKVAVHFDRKQTLVVLVNVYEFGTTGRVPVYGFRGSPPRRQAASVRLSREEARRLAEEIPREIPPVARAELVFEGTEGEADLVTFRWIRRVNGIPVLGAEDLNVTVDTSAARVVAWELGIFDFPASLIETRPEVPAEKAVDLAGAFLARTLPLPMSLVPSPPPRLVISGREPMWALLYSSRIAGSFYETFYVLVNALTGEVLPAGRTLR